MGKPAESVTGHPADQPAPPIAHSERTGPATGPASDGPATGPASDGPATGTPASDTETAFAEVLAGIMGVGEVPVDSHVFNDLGADSMLMARFCARVRKLPGLPAVSIKDVYRHPTIRGLALALTGSPAGSVIIEPVVRPGAPAGAG